MTRLGEIIEMDDGSLCPVWCNGTPAPGTVLFAEQKFLEADVFRAVQAAKKNAETSVSEAEYTLLMGRLSGRDFDLIQRAIDAALASQAAQGRSVAYWAAVDSDGTLQMTMSADDANRGLAARQEVNDWINETIAQDGVVTQLVGLYTIAPTCKQPLQVPNAPVVPKRAYYETHEAPHCPTCGCGPEVPRG